MWIIVSENSYSERGLLAENLNMEEVKTMDEIAKKANRVIIGQQFLKIGDINKAAVEAKGAYHKRRTELSQQTNTYTKEAIKEMQNKARADLRAKYATLHQDTKAQIEKLGKALRENHSQVSLSDPALANAVSIIKGIGPAMSNQTLSTINVEFAHNQPALRILRDAYKSAGVTYDGGLDRQIYNVETMLQELEKATDAVFLQEGYMSTLFNKVEKLATLEGLHFAATPDTIGLDEALHAGAGLPYP